MSRRQRHLTLRPSLGAALQLDSRVVAESVGSTVQTWPDRSGNGRNPTQATTTARATVVAETGGQKCLSFDGGDKYDIPASNTAFNGFHNGQPSILFAAVRAAPVANPAINAAYAICGTGRTESASTGFALLWDNRSIIPTTNAFRCDVGNGQGFSGGGAQSLLIAANEWSGGVWVIARLTTDSDASPVADRIIGRISGGPELKGNTRSFAPSAGNSTYNMQIGGPGGADAVLLNGAIGSIIAFPNHSLTAAMQLRIEHSLSASFKIACA